MKFIVSVIHAETVANIAKELEKRGHEVEWNPTKGNVPTYKKEGFYGLSADKEVTLTDFKVYNFKDKTIFQPHCLELRPLGAFAKGTKVLASNKDVFQRYKNVGLKVALVGWSKTDTLFNEEMRKKALSSVEHIKKNFPYDKTTLIAPTASWWGHVFPWQMPCILNKFKRMDMNLIIKPHPSWLICKHKEMVKYNQAKRMVENTDNMAWISPFKPLFPLYLISDVCITTRVSCVFKEFSMVGPLVETDPIPVASVNPADEESVKGVEWVKGKKEDLESLIAKALDTPRDKEKWETKLNEWFWKRDGKVSERSVKAIEEWGRLEDNEERLNVR